MSDESSISVRHAYDVIAETYATQRSEGTLGVEVLDRFLDSLPENARLLDAGCGQGTPVLARSTDSITAVGMDFSRGQLQLAWEHVSDGVLVLGDMTTLPFRDETFEAVTAYHSMIHVPMDEHRTVIDEFARVLRPDGRLILSEGLTEWSGENPDWLDSGVEMRWNMAGPETTEEQLRTAGFSIWNEWTVGDELADDDDAQKLFLLAQLDRQESN